MLKQALDKGFIDQCVARGINNPEHIHELMKVANEMLAVEQQFQKQAMSDKQRNALISALIGGGVGAGAGYMAGKDWQSALLGGGIGAGVGGGAGYYMTPEELQYSPYNAQYPGLFNGEYAKQYPAPAPPVSLSDLVKQLPDNPRSQQHQNANNREDYINRKIYEAKTKGGL